MIPIDEQHIRQILKEWVRHYNQGRPHSSLGPGIPEPMFPKIEPQAKWHEIPENHRVLVTPILAGLHHESKLERIAA
jgi:hypothetical protein